MRALALLFLPLAAASGAANQDDRGPGVPGQRQGDAIVYPVSGFDSVGLGTAATVEVRVGPAWSVRAVGPEAAFADFRVVREKNGLEIGRRYRHRLDDIALEKQMRVYITMPRIAAAALGGAGRMAIDRVTGDRFQASVGGSGRMAIAALTVDHAKLAVGGSGGIAAAGRVGSLEGEIGGSGAIDSPRLHAASANISIGGSGVVRAAVEGPAQVSMAGGGDVDLGPAARCTTSRIGGGRVRCG